MSTRANKAVAKAGRGARAKAGGTNGTRTVKSAKTGRTRVAAKAPAKATPLRSMTNKQLQSAISAAIAASSAYQARNGSGITPTRERLENRIERLEREEDRRAGR